MPINMADVKDPGSKPLPGGVVYGSGYTAREMFSAIPCILHLKSKLDIIQSEMQNVMDIFGQYLLKKRI
jgi:hypothetical protein